MRVQNSLDLTTPGTAHVITGNANNLPLANESVDLIVTSPPYFALRDYKDENGSLEGQIGAEPTPAEFLDALWTCAQEWWRVLAPGGSLWVNLGDKYATGGTGMVPQSASSTMDSTHKGVACGIQRKVADSARTKSLMGIPWRFAIGMTDGKGDPNGTGWILRAEVIWAKPNGLPESVKDRVRRSHEQWFHFTKSERYYSSVDAIREPYSETTKKNKRRKDGSTTATMPHGTAYARQGKDAPGEKSIPINALGKLPGSVWTIATEPLKVPEELDIQHFAAFPTEWPRRIILGWCPKGGVVLDPFGGTGTTAAVAKALGCVGISNDLSTAYNKLAEWRTNGDGYEKVRAKVLRQKTKKEPTPEQPALLPE